jgi:RNA polymerase sigma-70 factor, ECF subfamily
MDKAVSNAHDDHRLVQDCLTGSEEAWREFYARFIGLMRTVVRKHRRLTPEDVEDVTQAAFLSLTTALRTYDAQQSLPRFVCLVTERVLIDEYRRGKAAKRDADVEAIEHSDPREHTKLSLATDDEPQDAQMEKAELVSRLGAALRNLDARCKELITLRYLEELSFKEVAGILGSSENTVTVQTRRCLDSLRVKFREPDKKRGSRP